MPKPGSLGKGSSGLDFGAMFDGLAGKGHGGKEAGHGPGVGLGGMPLPQRPAKSLSEPMEEAPATAVAPIEQLGKPLGEFLQSVNSLQQNAEEMKQAFVTSGNVELHDVMIASEKAGVALNLTMAIRNKMLDAYQELSRINI
jgi:flagellar hook-basal body complex protein FliE